MTSLSPDAVAILWPAIQILGLAAGLVSALVGGLWIGFRWLRGQMREVGAELVSPVIERVALVEKSADAAHRRIDEWLGKRSP